MKKVISKLNMQKGKQAGMHGASPLKIPKLGFWRRRNEDGNKAKIPNQIQSILAEKGVADSDNYLLLLITNVYYIV